MPLALALVVAIASLEIAGDAICPDAASVRAELARLGVPALADQHHLVITRNGDAIAVELRSTTGDVIGARSLPVDAACGELAAAVAILVATWETELAANPIAPAPIVLARSERRPFAYAVAAGALAMAGRSARGVGGVVTAGAARAASPWMVEGSVGATRYEQQPLGRGEVDWSRATLGLGGRLRARRATTELALRGQALVGVLHASARGYQTNRSETAVSPGVSGGARVQLGRGFVTPYLDVGGVAWLRRDHLHVTGLADQIALPRFELSLALGVAIGGS